MSEKKSKPKGNVLQIILVVLLVGAAFAMGSMWTELRVLRGGNNQEVKPGAEVVKEEAEEADVVSDEMWERMIEGGAVKGDEGAEVTIVEFTDYQCPFCKRYVDGAYQDILTDYVEAGKVRYILRDLPLQFHANAQVTAEAARCAGDEGKYWEMHDKLFETQASWSESVGNSLYKTYAGELGLDQVSFDSCLDEGKYAQAVKDDLALAREAGVSGTPTFFVNQTKLVGAQPIEAFKALIDQELGQ